MSAYEQIKQRLTAGKIIVLDGGTGTELERRGAKMDPMAWCGPAALENTDILVGVHRDYIQAGADVITANTYATSRLMLDFAGVGDSFVEVNRAAINAAKQARDEAGNPNVVVAGSISHMVPRQTDGNTADFEDKPDYDTMHAAFSELATFLADEGAELLMVEMMYHPARMAAAFDAAAKTNLPIWAGFAAKQGDEGEVFSFSKHANIPFEETVKAIEGRKIEAAGVMHTPSHVVGDALEIVRRGHAGPMLAYPDSGYFKMPHWQFENVIEPDELLEFGRDWVNQGVQIIGGCCGLSPRHIEALATLRT